MQHIEIFLPVPEAVYRDSGWARGFREFGIDSLRLLAVNNANARSKFLARTALGLPSNNQITPVIRRSSQRIGVIASCWQILWASRLSISA